MEEINKMVKININNNKPKKWYESRTFVVNLLLIAAGIATWTSGEIATGSAITVAGIINAALRIITKQEIKF